MARLSALTRRPEFAALAGTVIVYLFFFWFGRPTFSTVLVTAGWVNVAAELAIVALPVALVMIAGHLDLSVGANIAASAITYALLTGHYGVPDAIALPAGVAVAVFFGFINGLIVTKTRVSSFIVTLAMSFFIRGLIFGVTKLIVSNVQIAVDVAPWVKNTFGGRIYLTYENAIYIAIVMAIAVSWILYKRRFGNWVFATGGDETSARAAGVPVDRTVIGLFMGSGFGAGLLGVTSVALYGSAQVSAGQDKVFYSIIAVVIGGVLLTGGYGSPIGVIFGCMTFAIVTTGVNSTDWGADWSLLIIGILLLVAVLANNSFRQLALSGSKPKSVPHSVTEDDAAVADITETTVEGKEANHV
jgi:simple sugar transport system permease protein